MQNQEIETKVASHYTQGNVTERILSALGLQNAAPGSVPLEALFPVDQLHHGGLGLTEKMAQAAGIKPGAKVLDAGSGIGGSARFLTARLGCQVEAIDLSDEFIQTAKDLDTLVGLNGNITHRVGSVTELPYEDASFDIVWSQNVTMNVPDKPAMFAEALRVLRPGGTYVLTHLGKNNNEPLTFPVPWSMTEETSFTVSPDEFAQHLVQAGFHGITDHARNDQPAPPPSNTEGQPDDSAAMGDDMPQRRMNAGQAVKDGRLKPMLVTAQRPNN